MQLNRLRKTPVLVPQQRGFSLLEAMISVVILSFGLLSIAALQVKSLQYSHNSYQRSVAINQANDAVERLWAGVCGLSDSGVLADIEEDWRAAHLDNTFGMAEWNGTIEEVSGSAPPEYEIVIEWEDPRLDLDADGNPVKTEFVYTTIIPEIECGSGS
ncbi:MAG: type IV pilus modification PilV family protein [Halothiobacillaceae bacterium]